jgi:FkbM family methyltransferase
MDDLVEKRDGWWWPKSDNACWPYLNREKEKYLPKKVFEYVDNFRNVVQAGGNCGFYLKYYAMAFENVYTFEPNHLNFYCLNLNITEKNVYKFQSCLGNNDKPVSLDIEKHSNKNGEVNIGGFNILKDAVGSIPVLKIDDLSLENVDLIHLDIEGYEGIAISGAVETIKRCKPTIALELRNHGKQYNWTDKRIEDLVRSLGYKIITKVSHDTIFKYDN